jgi:hypothetical protein
MAVLCVAISIAETRQKPKLVEDNMTAAIEVRTDKLIDISDELSRTSAY